MEEGPNNNKKKPHRLWWTKLINASTFFFTGLVPGIVRFTKSIITGNHFETAISGVSNASIVVQGMGFGSFIKKIRDNKTYQKISNFIEFVLPKPVRNILAIGCGIATFLTTGTWISLACLGLTCICQLYACRFDINKHQKIQSLIKELGLTKKYFMAIQQQNEIMNDLQKIYPNIDIKGIINGSYGTVFGEAPLINRTFSEESQDKTDGSNIISTVGGNLGIFPTSISAGLAITAIRMVGATAYSDIKADQMKKDLKKQLNEVRNNIPYYKDIKDLTDQANDQIFLCKALQRIKEDHSFAKANKDESAQKKYESVQKILEDKITEIKSKNKPIISIPKSSTIQETFKDTQNPYRNYGNITHAESILEAENELEDFKDQLMKETNQTNNIKNQKIRDIKDQIDHLPKTQNISHESLSDKPIKPNKNKPQKSNSVTNSIIS